MSRGSPLKIPLMILTLLFGARCLADDRFIMAPSRITDDELNAVAILAPKTKSVYFSTMEVDQVLNEFALIRARYPEFKGVREVTANAQNFSEILIGTSSSMRAQLEPAVAKSLGLKEPITRFRSDFVEMPTYQNQIDIARIGLFAPIESIKANFIVGRSTPLKVSYILLEFANIVNVPLIAQVPRREAEYITGNAQPGDGTRILRCPLSPTRAEYIISIGSNDCASACIDRVNHRFEVNTETKNVTRLPADPGQPVLKCQASLASRHAGRLASRLRVG